MACSTATLQNGARSRNDRFAIEEGGRLFGHYCSPCHGEKGQGDGRYYATDLEPLPPDLTDSAFARSRSDKDLSRAIAGGATIKEKANLCPDWGLTLEPGEIACLVRYIRNLQAGSGSPR